jgi:glycosyltransferase involved in cell wall biosynthesis
MNIILIVEGVFPEKKGGLERWYKYISKAFVDQGHQVTYINFSQVNEIRDGVQYRSVQNKEWEYRDGGKRSKNDSVQFAIRAAKILKHLEFDIIYCSSVPILSVFTIWVISRMKSRPMVVEWFEYWTLKYWVRYEPGIAGVLGWALQFIALQLGETRTVFNSATSRSVHRNLILKKMTAIEMMPGQCGNRLDLDFSPLNEIKENFMFVGRFVDEKQPSLAINCAISLRKSGWRGKLTLFGTGPNLNKLRDLIQEYEASDYIEIVVNATDGIIREAMHDSFVLFHPTRREGYGFVQVEAAFRGLPTILIRYPDNASTELNINPGLYASSGEVNQLTSVLLSAYKRQFEYKNATRTWALSASKTKSSESSVARILEIMVRLVG